MTQRRPEFYELGMSDSEEIASMLRHVCRPEYTFDASNDTVVVTRTLLRSAADMIDKLGGHHR